MVSAKPRRTAGPVSGGSGRGRKYRPVVYLTLGDDQGIAHEIHNLRLGHIFDRIQDQDHIITQPVDVIFAE